MDSENWLEFFSLSSTISPFCFLLFVSYFNFLVNFRNLARCLVYWGVFAFLISFGCFIYSFDFDVHNDNYTRNITHTAIVFVLVFRFSIEMKIQYTQHHKIASMAITEAENAINLVADSMYRIWIQHPLNNGKCPLKNTHFNGLDCPSPP